MTTYLFSFIEVLSVLGLGSPEHPGGDYSFCCSIEATDEASALERYVLLGDYEKARYVHSQAADYRDGLPIRLGEIVTEVEILSDARN